MEFKTINKMRKYVKINGLIEAESVVLGSIEYKFEANGRIINTYWEQYKADDKMLEIMLDVNTDKVSIVISKI